MQDEIVANASSGFSTQAKSYFTIDNINRF